jgi:hypothetical protein
MRLRQFRLFQLYIDSSQKKMDQSIAGAELWQSQGSFSFDCGVLEISLVVQSLRQFIVRVTGLGVPLNSLPIFFDALFVATQ